MKNLISALFLVLTSAGAIAQSIEYDWSLQVGTTGRDLVYDTKVDGQGNVYCIGNYEGVADFDPSVDTLELDNVSSTDIFVAKYSPQKDLIWAKSVGGSHWDTGYRLHIDENDNVFATGAFRGTVDFDPGVDTTSLTSIGDHDIFILKLDSNGDFVWAKNVGGSSADIGLEMETDANGNVYTVGYYQNTVDFDPGAGVVELTSNGDKDGFLLKLNANGDFEWVKGFGSTGTEGVACVEISESGDIYITGNFDSTVDFDPGPGIDTLVSNGSADAFLVKMDANGDYLWSKHWGGAGDDFSHYLDFDEEGNIYGVGRFEQTVDFDPGSSVYELVSNGDEDGYLIKLDTAGNLIWTKSFGGAESDIALGLVIDDLQYVHITGYFNDVVDFDPSPVVDEVTAIGEDAAFVTSFDIEGNHVWAVSVGGTFSTKGRGIACDNDGGLYFVGSFEGTVDFDPGVDTASVTMLGQYDGFLVKLDIQSLSTNSLEFDNSELSIYPNPVSNELTVRLKDFDEQLTSVKITDLSGKEVYAQNEINQDLAKIDVSNLKDGFYMVHVQVANRVVTSKIIKR